MITRIHINRGRMASNAKHGTSAPVITVKKGSSNRYGSRVDILDSAGNVAASIVYSPGKPLSCGAKAWIETNNDVVIHDEETITGGRAWQEKLELTDTASGL